MSNKLCDLLEKECDYLQSESSKKEAADIAKVRAYHEGYHQACEDYFKNAKAVLAQVEKEKGESNNE